MNGPHFATPQTPAAPRPAARPPARPAANAKAEGSGLLVLTYLRLHWMMILFCGTFLGTALAYAAWSLLPSKYESYALLQVASAPQSIAAQSDPSRGKADFVTY